MIWHDLSVKRVHIILPIAIAASMFLTFSCAGGGGGGNSTGNSIPQATLAGLSVLPATPTAAVGATVQFRAIGTFADNSTQDLSNQVTWSLSNTTVATISNTGLAAVVGPGTTTISAASGSLSASAMLTGTSTSTLPTTLTALSVSPAVQSAAVGARVQFRAIGTYSDNSTQDLSNNVTWSSSNPAAAGISSTGLATVLSAATTTISAASGSLSASATLTGIVPTATLTGLSMSPALQSAVVGTTVQFTAIGTYSDNSTQDLSNQVAWSSSNTTVATINGTGFAVVVGAGSTTISAASGSLSAGAILTGTSLQATLTSLSVLPAMPSAAIGATVQFHAVGTYSDNSTQDLSNQVTWSSTNSTVATINSTGLAAVVGSGITTISAASGAVSAGATLTAIGSAKVLLYATDNISSYPQVIATFNKVRLVSSSAAVSCDVLTPPVTLDIANLAKVMQLIGSSTCPAAQYNRIDLEFAQSVQLMDSAENTSSCLFVSYLNDADQPNALQCDPTTNTCTLEILGAVRSGAFDLLSTQVNKLALDFDLKKFTVQNFGDPANCSMAMKVVPLHDADIIQKGDPEVIAGSISNLNTGAQTFTLARGNVSTTVNYAAVVNSSHPGIAGLLQTVLANGISVMVSSADLGGLNTNTVAASDISIKLEGTVSNLTKSGSERTFTLTYDSGKTMTILSSPPIGKKHGNLVDGAWVEVQLYGYDSASGSHLSSLVSVQKPGTKTDN